MGYHLLSISLEGGRALAASAFQSDTATELAPQKMVVLMHGWGADSQDLAPLAPMLAADAEMSVIVPDAPDICSANPFGRQWFELASPDLASEMVAQACSGGVAIIHQMLDSLSAAFGVSAENIFLGGFSQGGMIALSAGLGYSRPLGGVFCLSGGWLTPHQSITQENSLPIFLAHGAIDPVVPLAMMEASHAALLSAGFSAQSLVRPAMPHSIDEAVIEALAGFIAKNSQGRQI